MCQEIDKCYARYCPKCKVEIPNCTKKAHDCGTVTVPLWSEMKRRYLRATEQITMADFRLKDVLVNIRDAKRALKGQ